jgi:hypothetical protein
LTAPALKLSFLLCGVLSALALGVSQASAATPCWRTLVNDWYDGRIDNTYPVHCYTEALHHIPPTDEAYFSVRDDIKRALAAAIRQHNGRPLKPNDPVTPATVYGNRKGGGPTAQPPVGREAPRGWFRRAIDAIGPGNADSLPLPLVVLGSVALLLLLAALGSFLAKRFAARRMEPAPAPANPPKRP